MAWWRRRPRRVVELCPGCGHDWDEHSGGGWAEPGQATCGECGYEVDHGERTAGDECVAVRT